MSLNSRREYVSRMKSRYLSAKGRSEKTKIIDEVIEVTGYQRKYAIQVLNRSVGAGKPKRVTAKRQRPIKYLEALPAIELCWQALDYPCAERLHPVLAPTAKQLAKCGHLTLTPQIAEQLEQISRPTLARRIATNMSSPKVKRQLPRPKPGSIKSQISIERYAWDETKPGALEVDLVEHNGGSSLGHFAYTLTVVDVVTGWSRRRSMMGRSQTAVLGELELIAEEWPHKPWGLHTDNGSEFLNGHLVKYAKKQKLKFTRSRPYKKNDNAHVEQKNRQFVREMVGYERYDTLEEVEWLNHIYRHLDPYANLCLPMRKLIGKERLGVRVRKTYDRARSPAQRLLEGDVLTQAARENLCEALDNIDPLLLHKQLEFLLGAGPELIPSQKVAAD